MKNRDVDFWSRGIAILACSVAMFVTMGCQRQKLDIKTSMRGQPAFDKSKSSSESSSATMSSSATTDQQLSAPDHSTIAGAAVTVRPGTLAVDATVTVQEGATLASQATLDELGIDSGVVEASAPAVIVSSGSASDPVGNLLITIPAPTAEGLALTGDDARLAVVYLIEIKKLGIVLSGIMPRSLLTVANGLVSFEAPHFGSFQAVFLKEPIQEKKEVKSSQTIKTRFGDVLAAPLPAAVKEPVRPEPVIAPKPVVDSTPTDKVDGTDEQPESPQAPAVKVVSFQVKGDGMRTVDRNLTLTIEVSGPAKQMYLSESSDCKGAGAWVAFSPTGSLRLSADDGVKSVSVKVKNDAGIESNCLALTIELVTPPYVSPPPPLDAFAYDRSVKLQWGRAPGVLEYLVIRAEATNPGRPEHLQTYAEADTIGAGKVVYKGTADTFVDDHVTNGRKYTYVVYSAVAGPFYSAIGRTASAVPFAGFTAVSAGDGHTCALAAAGDLYCWGSNTFGQLGVGDTNPRNVPTKVDVSGVAAEGDKHFIAVSAGHAHTCAVAATGKGFCWGKGENGRLGSGSAEQFNRPETSVDALTENLRFTQISAGYDHSCGVSDSGALYCWGGNTYGQLGNKTNISSLQAVTSFPSSIQYKSVSAGKFSSCAISSVNDLRCWGSDTDFLVGDGSPTSNKNVPTAVAGGVSYIRLPNSGRTSHWCAVRADNMVACWGRGANGRLGRNSTDDKNSPNMLYVQPNNGEAPRRFLDIAVTSSSSCGIDLKGDLYCWGSHANGKLGTATAAGDAMYPLAAVQTGLRDGEKFKQITGGGEHLCGLTSRGVIYCWGSNGGTNGALGIGSSEEIAAPQFLHAVAVQGIQSMSRFLSVDYGPSHACAVRTDGQGLCWGGQQDGRLANGLTEIASVKTPVPVQFSANAGAGKQFRQISAGGSHGCGVTADGKAWCWGSDASGQIGDGDPVNSSGTAVPVGDAASDYVFVKVEAGDDFTCGIIDTGHTVCWGSDGYGQLGTLSSGNSNVPVSAYASLTTDLSAGGHHACLIKSNGDSLCWGRNDQGQLGSGTTSNRTTPGSLSGAFVRLSAGDSVTCGLRAIGEVACWGGGITSPTTVTMSDSVNIKEVTAGSAHMCGLSGAGKVFCWGAGSSGQLGNGDDAAVTDPVPVRTQPLGSPAEFISLTAGGDSTGGILSDGRAFVWGKNTVGQLGDGTLNGASQPKPMNPPPAPPVSPSLP